MKLFSFASKILENPGDLERLASEAREEHDRAQRGVFAELVAKSIPERTERREALVTNATAEVEKARKALFAAERKMFEIESSADPTEISKHFEDEIAEIQRGKIKGITRIFFSPNGHSTPILHALTDEIKRINPETKEFHLIGHYEIVVDFDSNYIRFLNRDRQPMGKHGPHIKENGHPCLGTIADDMASYIAHYEVNAVLSLAYLFLNSKPWMGDEWGEYIKLFPVIDQEAA